MATLYEILIIINPNESDEGVDAIIGGLRQQIDKAGGTILAVDKWGSKKLAFSIQKNDEGIYVLIHAEGPGNLPTDFRAHTKIRESILRELVVKLEGPQEEAVRARLEEKGPEDEEKAAAQIAAAEDRADEKRAEVAAAVSGPAAEEEGEEAGEGEEETAETEEDSEEDSDEEA